MKSNKFAGNLFTRLVILFFVVVVVSWGVWLWWKDGTTPVDPTDTTPVTFVVVRGDGAKAIAAKLYQENLVRSSTAFYIMVKFLGLETQLQAGDFRLHKAMTAEEIAQELTHGIVDVWVTTLEGWRAEEIATKLAKDLDIPEQEFLKFAKEGYMFPDTYLIPRDATAAAIAKQFQENFDKKITDQMRSDVKKLGLTMEDAIILASVVEREGRSDEDRPMIAGILLNRLKAEWPLQADATLQYALGYQSYEKTWWKKGLTDVDKKVKSSFNTYVNPGLPPKPISNPGIASIKAAVYPKESEYWYYLHDPAGGVHYAKTLEEHNANIAQYLQ